MNVMLLAAGEGTRLRPFTHVLPKPAIPFLNIPLAAHALNFLNNTSVDKLVVNTYHLPNKVTDLFKGLHSPSRSLHFSAETELLGSAGGLGKAREHFIGGSDFIMMNADEVILPDDENIVERALIHHRQSKNFATLMVMEHPGVGSQFGGVWTDSHNRVLGFGKTPIKGSVKGWHFIGVQVLSEQVFEFIPNSGASNILYDSLTTAIQKGHRVDVFPFACKWFETGNLHDLLEATKSCLAIIKSSPTNSAKKSLLRVLAKHQENSLVQSTSDSDLLIGNGATILEKSHLSGFCILGANSIIEENCELHDVVVGPNVLVPSGTKAQNTLFL